MTSDCFAVVLGGDSPFAPPLIAQLERKGYIVITSVENPDSVDAIERQSHGYVRALVLDPNLVSSFVNIIMSSNS